jgi:hypothetical protein
MNKISLAAAAVALAALSACDRGKQEQLGNDVELNTAAPTEDLNALSDQAAEVAAEAQQLENHAAALEEEAADGNAAGPQTPEDENIQGM